MRRGGEIAKQTIFRFQDLGDRRHLYSLHSHAVLPPFAELCYHYVNEPLN